MPTTPPTFLPEPVTTLWSGKIQDEQHLVLTIGGTALQGNIEEGKLMLSGSSGNGIFSHTTWHMVASEHQANQFSTSFDQYAQARIRFAILKATIDHPPNDSNYLVFASMVSNAETYVADLRQRRNAIQSEPSPCGSGQLALFRTFYPPDVSQFRLSSYEEEHKTAEQNAQVTAAKSTLAKDREAFQSQWEQATDASTPPLAKVALDWKSPPPNKDTTLKAGQKMLSTLERLLESDYKTMASLKKEADSIGQDVEHVAKQHGC